jgi:hypothetical protein
VAVGVGVAVTVTAGDGVNVDGRSVGEAVLGLMPVGGVAEFEFDVPHAARKIARKPVAASVLVMTIARNLREGMALDSVRLEV